MKKIKVSNIFDHLNEWGKIMNVKIKDLPENPESFLEIYILSPNIINHLTKKKFYSYTKNELATIISGLSNDEVIDAIKKKLLTESNIDKYFQFIGIDTNSSEEISQILNTIIIPNFERNNIKIFGETITKVNDEFIINTDEPEYYYDEVISKGEELSDNAISGELTHDEEIEYQVIFVSHLLNMFLCGKYTDSLINDYMLPEFDNSDDSEDLLNITQDLVKSKLLDVFSLSILLSNYTIDNSKISDIFNSDNIVDSYPFNDSFDDLHISLNDWSKDIFKYDLFKNVSKSKYAYNGLEINSKNAYIKYFDIFVKTFSEFVSEALTYFSDEYQFNDNYPFGESLDVVKNELITFGNKLKNGLNKIK